MMLRSMMTRIRTYSELMNFDSFGDRFEYLRLRGVVSDPTFGFDRWINQGFYTSREWKHARANVIARDLGCDLAVPGYEIHAQLVVHHMNPMEVDDIVDGDPAILDPEFLITTTHRTHNAIHYGDERLLPRSFVERRPGDTKLW